MTQNFDCVSVLSLSGEDCAQFLNNQLVSEVSKITQFSYSAICNAKGRIIYSLWIQPTASGFLLGVDEGLSESLQQYINMRKFRMDVQITSTDQQLQVTDGHTEHYDLGHFSFAQPTDKPASADAFWRIMFSLNLPWITQLTTEMFIPQHVNLDQAHVIAFDKGCYPGQEIVARLHFIGQVKKRLQMITYQNPHSHPVGTVVEVNDMPNPVEICAPSIKIGAKWQTQAIVPL